MKFRGSTAIILLWISSRCPGYGFQANQFRSGSGNNFQKSFALSSSSNGNQQFDLAKPQFDLLTLRNIRGDALLRYNTLNQSEPLRINLFGLLALVLFSASSISEAVSGESMNLPETALSVLGGLGSMGLFVRECGKRSSQLIRIEKELNAEYLQIRLPSNALADQPFQPARSFGALAKTVSPPPRVVAICGTASDLKEQLMQLHVIGRRLKQAGAYVVPVPTDSSKRSDWGMEQKVPWLAEASGLEKWLDYFDGLSSDDGEFRWFGLNSNGRSFGSGSGEAPQWIQVMGSFLRPIDVIDRTDSSVETVENASVLQAQQRFYDALTDGNRELMNTVFSEKPTTLVSDVVSEGGRIDDWEACLADGARPKGMLISSCDATVVVGNKAFSTCIEFPANTGMDDASLLAVQQWTRVGDDWKLELHKTIPWNSGTRAQGTLRCDCRGCVALTRGEERRTFGGIIG